MWSTWNPQAPQPSNPEGWAAKAAQWAAQAAAQAAAQPPPRPPPPPPPPIDEPGMDEEMEDVAPPHHHDHVAAPDWSAVTNRPEQPYNRSELLTAFNDFQTKAEPYTDYNYNEPEYNGEPYYEGAGGYPPGYNRDPDYSEGYGGYDEAPFPRDNPTLQGNAGHPDYSQNVSMSLVCFKYL